MGGNKYELDMDDYIIAAMDIYLDIIVLFFKILELLNAVQEK